MRPWTLALILTVSSGAVGCKDEDKGAEPAADEPSVEGAPSTAGEAPQRDPAEPAPPRAELPADTGTHGGAHAWSVRFGSGSPDAARSLARLPGGDLLVAGYFKGAHPFDDDAPAGEAGDAYVARLGGDGGAVRWSLALGGPAADTADTVAAGPDGSAVVAGSFGESLQAGAVSLRSAGADDIFVAKVGADGALAWARGFGGPDVDAAHAVAVAGDGTIYVTGVFRGEVAFDDTTLASEGDADIFLVALDAKGAVTSARSFGALGPDYGRSIAIDGRGDLVLLAEFSRSVDFGGDALDASGNRDLALVKLDRRGQHLWSKGLGNDLDEIGLDLAIDPADDILVTGSFDDALSFGGDELTAAGRSDAFVAKYDADGAHLWSHRFGGKDEDIGAAVATDAHGNVYATGWFWFETDFGGGALESAGKKDVYLVKLSPEGAHLWAKRFGSKEVDFGKGLAVDEAGGVALAGTFHVDIDLGGDRLEQAADEGALVPAGDIFVASFGR